MAELRSHDRGSSSSGMGGLERGELSRCCVVAFKEAVEGWAELGVVRINGGAAFPLDARIAGDVGSQGDREFKQLRYGQ